MAEWIDYPAQTPAVRFLHGHDQLGSCRECPREDRIWIRHGQDHPNRASAQGLWTEVGVFRRLVAHPKLRTIDGQPRYDSPSRILHTMHLARSECGFVEFNGSRAIPHRQHWSDRTGD
jgi:hypothetical protein